MFRLSPVSAIHTKAPAKATGRPIAAQIAKPGRKNRLMTATTRTSPITPFCTSITRRSRMIDVTSCTTSTEIVSGRRAVSSATSAATPSSTRSASASSAFDTSSRMAGTPSTKARSCGGSKRSSISATSPSVRVAPLGRTSTGIAVSAVAVSRSAVKRRVRSAPGPSSVPAGRSMFCAAMAAAKAAGVSPWLSSTGRDAVMKSVRVPRPPRVTLATPGRTVRRSDRASA